MITSVKPLSGPSSGNTLVTIFGSNFNQTNEIVVKFFTASDERFVNGSFDSITKVLCESPAWPYADAAVEIEVALNGQQFSSSHPFTFYGMLLLISILMGARSQLRCRQHRSAKWREQRRDSSHLNRIWFQEHFGDRCHI